MKKRHIPPVSSFIVLVIAVLMALATARTILADGGPHGGYGNISGACAACHRTHTGSGTFVLYSAAQDNTFCYTCHDGTGASVPPVVSTHGNTDYAASAEEDFELLCVQCHDPHGAANLYTIRESVVVQPGAFPTRSGPVAFTAITGTNSFDDGLGAPNSRICVVCHSNNNNPGYPIDSHDGGANHDGGVDYSEQDCTTCHQHSVDDDLYTQDGFMASCTSCHGQPPNGGASPNLAGSHSTHFAPIPFGPQISTDACDTCHLFSAATHNDGQATFTDGQPLATTTACDGCHSPGGSFNGVNSVAGSVGAKDNWASGVYVGNDLMAGKEKWCAGCHDQAPSTIQSTDAPNVIGDQDGNYNYDVFGLGWGYYKTGHGVPITETYPASGDVVAGAGVNCDGCHDFSTAHIDGEPRTYNDGDSSGTDPALYRQGYRLKLSGGLEPFKIPLPQVFPDDSCPSDGFVCEAQFRLCFECHDPGPFVNAGNMNTNLVTDGVNRHWYHFGDSSFNNYRYQADWSGNNNSRITCMSCHNVHGSTRLAMVRDGSLIGRDPGLLIWYYNSDIVLSYNSPPDMEPDPQHVPLAASEGTIWLANSSSNLCSHCHHNSSLNQEPRVPFQDVAQAPILNWTSETGYVSDGVDPESALAESVFEFRIEYTDKNHDPPSPIEVWVDENDNGSYEPGERYVMTEADPSDRDRTEGKLYTRILPLSKDGDNTFTYCFFASDPGGLTAQTPDRTVTVANNPPTLSWTEQAFFEADGVHPDIGANGGSFEFRVTYADVDGDAPSVIQVWIDVDEDGSYEPGEQFAMTAGSGDYATGRLYSYSTLLNYVVDGVINYTFRANDGTNNATTEAGPLANNDVTVAASSNNVSMLDWVVQDCLTNGVKPARGLASGDFQFSVKYTDPDNQCPPANGYVRVWVDQDDDDVQDAGETYDLTAGAGDCSNGKIYSTTVQLAYDGDGDLTYQFSASDGTDAAIGAPALSVDNQVTVVSTTNTVGVRTGSIDFGSLWYNQLQTAIDAVSNSTILVYEGTYNENVRLDNNPAGADEGITLESVCGPEVTTINAAGNTVFIETIGTYAVVDGFSITGGSNGITINGAFVTVNNSIIRNNNRGIYSGSSSNRLIVQDSVIRDNVGATSGAGIYYHDGIGAHSISNSIIQDNASTGSGIGNGNGGGLFIQNLGANITIDDCTITGNSANLDGGGIYINNSSPIIRKTVISSNTSSANGGGVYMNGSISSITFENSNVTGNTAADTGGGVRLQSSGITADIINSTISKNELTNTTTGQGGGIYANTVTVLLRNSILWGNDSGSKESGYEIFTNNGNFTFDHSVVPNNGNALTKSGVAGSFNIDATNIYTDPLFAGGTPFDYHLKSISPAVDRGTATGAPGDDIDGDSRPQGAGVDMGSDELSLNRAPVLAWTGDAGYASDGVNPEGVLGGSTFVFRVTYTDADNIAPTSIQVWIDLNDDGDYDDVGEKENMALDPGDGNYANGEIFTRSFILYYVGNGNIRYTFRASDGAYDATGTPTSDRTFAVSNNAPILAWPSSTGYTTDGVDPDIGTHGISFTFKINYADVDNNAPTTVQVWIDQNDDGSYQAGEQYTLDPAGDGDGNYGSGENYTRTLVVNLRGGNSDGTITYRFYASDGTDDATGTPMSNETLVLANAAPTLNWVGLGNYVNDGVDPDSAASGSNFEFRVVYTDVDNNVPELLQVWVDEDDNSTYEESEKYNITNILNPDGNYANGETFTRSLTLHDPGGGSDGVLNYRFYATDGGAQATGTPPISGTNTVALAANNSPTLAWEPGACRTGGVSPRTGAIDADYEFLVNYTDADNGCPASGSSDIQVWVDLDGNGYDAGEQHNLTEISAADTDCTDGKIYRTIRTLNSTGDFDYRFYASDGALDASGSPTADSVVTVIDAVKVRASGGIGWQSTIQTGVNASSDGDTVLVYPQDDFTAETYYEDVFANTATNNRTIRAVCGPDLTVIDGSTYAIGIQHSSNVVIDGFTLTGANDGVNVNNTSPLTITNCEVHGNSRGINSFDTRNNLIISNCEIYDNSTTGDGAGVYFNSGTHQIISTTLMNNQARNGGGVHCQSACQVSIQESVINGNTGTNAGGGVYLLSTGSRAIITDTFIQGNDSGGNGGGGIYVENGTSANMTNVVLTGNRTTGLGGAVNERGYADYLFCTLSGNYANSGGGAIYHLNATVTTIQNSIIYNNDAGYGGPAGKDYQIFTNNNRWSAMDVYNTLINQAPSTGTWPDVAGYQDMGGNNNSDPPSFVNGLDPSSAPTTGGNYHIQSGSACINAASSSYPFDHDIDGDSRPQDGGYDMGADEM